ncbi:MAG: hypothetical protein BRC26_03895 [Nanohaloarchaea archaeon QH_8_44_6]|nr:MAG: hypothetical protein BRC26_03895 [Nanohaloarchaea archaeon QH_8_44_6]
MVDYDYNKKADILTVDLEDRQPEDYDRSIAIGDYTVDLDEAGSILGIEILNATRNLPYTSKELQSIENADLKQVRRSGARTVIVEIEYSSNKGAFSLGYQDSIEA